MPPKKGVGSSASQTYLSQEEWGLRHRFEGNRHRSSKDGSCHFYFRMSRFDLFKDFKAKRNKTSIFTLPMQNQGHRLSPSYYCAKLNTFLLN